MLKIDPPDYKNCPFCGKMLSEKTEEGKTRKYCKTDNWTYYPHVMASVAAIILDGDKMLLVKRNRNPYKNTWMFPAGFIDFGEHPEDALAREVGEEVGLELNSFELFKIKQSTDDPRAPGHFIFFYITKVTGKIKNQDIEENSEIAWFEINTSPKIGWQQHREVLKDLQKRN